jgi:glycosyltransferase involved in cell wall biosynthesis
MPDLLRVDSWFTGRRGDFQQPLVHALVAAGEIDLRLLFAAGSARAPAMAAHGLPSIESPTASLSSSALGFPSRVLATRRQLNDWYRHDARGVVHVTMLAPWDLLFLDIPKRAGATILVTIHDAVLHLGEENPINEMIIGALIAQADHIVTLSKSSGEVLREKLKGRMPIHVISRGLIVDASTPRPPKAAPHDRPLKLLFFGRILEYKGLDLALEALELLRAEGGPNVELTIAGSGDLAPYRAALGRLPDVRLIVGDWMSDETKAAIFEEHDAQIVPYRATSVSGVVLSGLWAGMPTIATPLEPFFECLEDDGDCVFSTEVSPRAIAAAIRKLAESPELFDRLANGAHDKAHSLSAPIVAGLWRDLYREISPR